MPEAQKQKQILVDVLKAKAAIFSKSVSESVTEVLLRFSKRATSQREVEWTAHDREYFTDHLKIVEIFQCKDLDTIQVSKELQMCT